MNVTIPVLLAVMLCWGFVSVVLVETLVVFFLVFRKMNAARFPLKSIRETSADAWHMNQRSVMQVLATAVIVWGCIGICLWQESPRFLEGSFSIPIIAIAMVLVPTVAIVVLRRKQMDARSAVQVMTILCGSTSACWALPFVLPNRLPLFAVLVLAITPAGTMLVLFAVVIILLLMRQVTATGRQSATTAAYQSSKATEGAPWYYGHDGTRLGPVSIGELRKLIAADKLCADDLVWRKGMIEWAPLGRMEGLFLPPLLPSKRQVAGADAAILPRHSDGVVVVEPVADSTRFQPLGPRRNAAMLDDKGILALGLGITGTFAWLVPILGLPVTVTGLILGLKARHTRTHTIGTVGAVLCAIAFSATLINFVMAFLSAGGRYGNSRSPLPYYSSPMFGTSGKSDRNSGQPIDPREAAGQPVGASASSSSITCDALAIRIANLCGSSNVQVAFQPQKPGYDKSYMFPGGMVTKARIISAIGEPDSGGGVKTGEYGYIGDEEWIYQCKDGEVCLQLCRNPNAGYVTIPNFAVHSRSR